MAKEKICELCKRANAECWFNKKGCCKICWYLSKCTSSTDFTNSIKKRNLWDELSYLYPDAVEERFGKRCINRNYVIEVIEFHKNKYI